MALIFRRSSVVALGSEAYPTPVRCFDKGHIKALGAERPLKGLNMDWGA